MNKNFKYVLIGVLFFGISFIFGFYAGKNINNKTESLNFLRSERTGFAQNNQKVDANNRNFNSRNMSWGQKEEDVISGEIISLDDKGITLKTRNGGTKIVLFKNDIKISKQTEGSKSDLIVGKNVMIFGKSDSSGILIADSAQIMPEFFLKK